LLALIESVTGPDTLMGRALSLSGAFGSLRSSVWNTREVHAAEIPAANGIADARSVSRMYAGLIGKVDGVQLFSDDTVDAARTPHADGPDQVLMGSTTRFGRGFMLAGDFAPFGGSGTFGHPGAGGSVGFCDPERGVAIGYVMNRMQQNLAGDPRTIGIVDAVYGSL
jgi:CubicO group peptidase (beta-lactamase class C family)